MPANSPKIDIQVTPQDMYRGKLRRRLNQISDLEPANKKAAIWLDAWVQRNFRSQGGKVGGWEPLKYREGMILQDTGMLRSSFRPFADKNDAGIGSDLDYSAPHESGTATLPQRRMLPRHNEVDQDLFRIYNRHVEVLTGRAL